MEKTKVIAFCGIDGCGKTSQIKCSNSFLNEQGMSSISSKLSYMPLNDYGHSSFTDHMIQVRSVYEIAKHYALIRKNECDFVLADRHMICYLSYAMATGTKNISIVKNILNKLDIPDLILYFDVDIEEAIKRIMLRCSKDGSSINKTENISTLIEVKKAYQALLPTYSDYEIIDANKSVEEVSSDVNKILTKRFLKS